MSTPAQHTQPLLGTLPLLRTLPRDLRAVLIAFLLTMYAGVLLGSGFVSHTTRLLPTGIAERFVGTERMGIAPESLPPGREIVYEKSAHDLYSITHTHIIGLSIIFLATAVLFLMSGRFTPRWRRAIAVEPFASLVLTFGGMWLVRYVHPAFAWLVAASGTVMMICITVMVGVCVRELGSGRE